MSDRDFWLIIKRALQMIIKAIERKYPSKDIELEMPEVASISYLADD